jgi:uncharacterized protein YjbI with pentapeptide repeats
VFTDRDGNDISYRIERNANLTNANLARANLTGADLTDVIGWDTVKGKDTIVGLDEATGVPN